MVRLGSVEIFITLTLSLSEKMKYSEQMVNSFRKK